jgi:hypothetical protein
MSLEMIGGSRMSKSKNYGKFFREPDEPQRGADPETLATMPDVIEEEFSAPLKAQQLTVVKCKTLNVRPTPSTANEPIEVVSKDTTLFLHYYADDWAYVATPSGVEGFVMREYTKEV